MLITAAFSEITVLTVLGIYKYYTHMCMCAHSASLYLLSMDIHTHTDT